MQQRYFRERIRMTQYRRDDDVYRHHRDGKPKHILFSDGEGKEVELGSSWRLENMAW